jgi:hypothetical protein
MTINMKVLVSLALLISALFVILSKRYGAGAEQWAYAIITVIVGSWLKR